MWSSPRTVLITGATGGIGTALAHSYAGPGRTLILHGRDATRLDTLARSCEARGATVHRTLFDLTQPDTVLTELRAQSRRCEIDLLIVNAGVTGMVGDGEQLESPTEARKVLAVNLDGALASIAGVLPEMRRRGRGQIALVSSLAACIGIPQVPVYSASKAALKAYGEALRAWLHPRGIAVSVVLLGFVRTPMTEGFAGPTPMLVSAERAAQRIRRGLERNQARIVYPRTLGWALLWLAALPPPLTERILRMAGFSPSPSRPG